MGPTVSFRKFIVPEMVAKPHKPILAEIEGMYVADL